MPELLTYAPRPAWHRRSRGRLLLAAFVVAVIAGAAAFAVPEYKAFQARQEQREAIRRDFKAELATAATAIDAGHLADAAGPLVRAAFPRHVHADLFGERELAQFDRSLHDTRARMIAARKPPTPRGEPTVVEEDIHRSPPPEREVMRICVDRYTREETVIALGQRAAQQYAKGNFRQALGISEQIAIYDPWFDFHALLWPGK